MLALDTLDTGVIAGVDCVVWVDGQLYGATGSMGSPWKVQVAPSTTYTANLNSSQTYNGESSPWFDFITPDSDIGDCGGSCCGTG